MPRTKASCVDTNVTEVAVNPLGTGPPGGGAGIMGVPGVTDGAAVGVAAGVRAAAGGGDGPDPAPLRKAATIYQAAIDNLTQRAGIAA